MTPLIAAAYNGHSDVVALLAEKGANIQAQTNVRENA
jgi:ankyrin repeat protein